MLVVYYSVTLAILYYLCLNFPLNYLFGVEISLALPQLNRKAYFNMHHSPLKSTKWIFIPIFCLLHRYRFPIDISERFIPARRVEIEIHCMERRI